jgi:nucleoside-diphosphate-sugar epimerase
MRFHTAVNKFCWQAVMKQPISIWRTALHQKRPYLDLNDAVAALTFIINQNLYDGRVYNVLTTNATVNDLIQIISLHIPDISIEYVDNEIMNQLSYEVANEHFKNQGFKFNGDLKNGIFSTIKLLKNSNIP